MDRKELKELFEALGLAFEAEPTLMYIFYKKRDGTVHNLSVSIRHDVGDERLRELMREYPDAREGEVMAIERPMGRRTEWVDTVEVCELLHTSKRTLRRWSEEGVLTAHRVGKKCYYDRAEVDEMIRSNVVTEDGRLDRGGQIWTNEDKSGQIGTI